MPKKTERYFRRRDAEDAERKIVTLFNSSLRGLSASASLRRKLSPSRYNPNRVLLELVVENYAVVERLRVHFHAGLNLLTGETGSGKSIVVDALGLLLGARASAEMVRTGESRARGG